MERAQRAQRERISSASAVCNVSLLCGYVVLLEQGFSTMLHYVNKKAQKTNLLHFDGQKLLI